MFRQLFNKIFLRDKPKAASPLEEVPRPLSENPESQAQYEKVLSFLRGFPVKGPTHQVLEVPKRGTNSTPKSFISLDADLKKYLRRLKVNDTKKAALEVRLLVVNFLDQYSPGLEGISDSFIASLEALLLAQRKAGIRKVRPVSRKRRKK